MKHIHEQTNAASLGIYKMAKNTEIL